MRNEHAHSSFIALFSCSVYQQKSRFGVSVFKDTSQITIQKLKKRRGEKQTQWQTEKQTQTLTVKTDSEREEREGGTDRQTDINTKGGGGATKSLKREKEDK